MMPGWCRTAALTRDGVDGDDVRPTLLDHRRDDVCGGERGKIDVGCTNEEPSRS
jgi:hypothetical protein